MFAMGSECDESENEKKNIIPYLEMRATTHKQRLDIQPPAPGTKSCIQKSAHMRAFPRTCSTPVSRLRSVDLLFSLKIHFSRRNISLPLQLVLLDVKRHLQQVVLLLQMRPLQTRRHTRARIAPGVHDVLAVVEFGVVQQGLDPRLGEAPGTRVQRLLLRPHHRLGVAVHVQVLLELGPGKGIQLLDAGDGRVLELFWVGGAVLVQGCVDLAGAEDHALDLVGRADGAIVVGGVGDYPLEVRLPSEFIEVGAGKGVAEKRFAEEEDEC